jgi:hypothetical protein
VRVATSPVSKIRASYAGRCEPACASPVPASGTKRSGLPDSVRRPASRAHASSRATRASTDSGASTASRASCGASHGGVMETAAPPRRRVAAPLRRTLAAPPWWTLAAPPQ